MMYSAINGSDVVQSRTLHLAPVARRRRHQAFSGQQWLQPLPSSTVGAWQIINESVLITTAVQD